MPRTYVKSQRQHGVSVILALAGVGGEDGTSGSLRLNDQPIQPNQRTPSSAKFSERPWFKRMRWRNNWRKQKTPDLNRWLSQACVCLPHDCAHACTHMDTHTHTFLWNTKQDKKPLYLTRCSKGCCPWGISVENEEQKLLRWWTTPVWMILTQRIHFVQIYSGAVSSNLCVFMYLS